MGAFPGRAGLAINALEDEVMEAAAFCRREALGIEVASFAFAAGLDEGFRERVERHADALQGVPWVSVHGPFLDLYVTSPDPAIVAVCERRHRAGIEAAGSLGARFYVAHLNSVPLIRNQAYRDRFCRSAADFWLPLADEAGKSGTTIVLENMWEPEPDLQRGVVDAADHPHLRASFDNGHALVFSRVPASSWIEALGDALLHCHLHDNDGAYDHHWPVGEGSENWRALRDAFATHAPDAAVILESDRLEANRKSLAAARVRLGDPG